MKLKMIYILICILFVLTSNVFAAVTGSTADPTEMGLGARPLSLGKAYVGFSDDANTIFVNPAGHAKIDGLKFTSMKATLLQEIDYLIFGVVQPYDYGTLGIGYINVGVDGIPVTTITGGNTIEVLGATDYSASVLLLSYSNDAKRIPWLSGFEDTTVGLNMKLFSQGFNGGGAALADGSGSGFDMDLGLQYKPSKPVTIGLSLINILPESLGGRFAWATGTIENIPSTIKLGAKTKLLGKEDALSEFDQDVYLGSDIDSYPTQNKPMTMHLGAEWWPTKVMAFRLGVDQKAVSRTAVESNLTTGLGIRARGFSFDYSYHQFGDLSENVTHFFSIGYLGPEKKMPMLIEEPQVILPVVIPKPNLKSFSDVSDGYWAKGPIEFMATLDVMSGYEDGSFKPEEPITRAQLAKVLVSLKEMNPNDVSYDPYPDVSKDNWAAKYIKAATFLKFMGPYPDGTFLPDKLVTRSEGLITLMRFESIKPIKGLSRDPYPDVKKFHWAAGSIAAAKKRGYLDYLPADGIFDGNKDLTRAELAEMLSKTEYGRKRIKKLLEE